jgi:hypothetical protein
VRLRACGNTDPIRAIGLLPRNFRLFDAMKAFGSAFRFRVAKRLVKCRRLRKAGA